MTIQNVALIGASGTLGPSILHALRASEFTPFVLNRHTSKSVYPKTRVITIPDDLNVTELSSLFKSNAIDALVIVIAGSYVEEQKKLIEAAYNGGVKRIIPAEFGSCDSADDKTVKLLPLMEGKKRVREYLQSFEVKERDGERGNLTWTSLVTGHFFDWGLDTGFLKFDIPGRKAYILDGGDIKFSASTLGFIAKAVVKVLEREAETRNKLLYVHSHYVTQNEVTDVLDRVVGEKFERVPQDARTRIEKARPKMLEGDHEATEEVVAVHGIVASDWEGKEGFANAVLGLELESLEETIEAVTKKSSK
ncbi:hypothetical protein B0J11DRAFT_528287 [Dendryphion nanum]|uniref:NmrA-like domain-containing protein n=1 Tax=Dendryphion nanum TaxID=256645 RepID=A0A9P9DUP4_9PLEO|nr:hypothetical protein B0J11DRAFT_528287 [Dendryphion nanum]